MDARTLSTYLEIIQGHFPNLTRPFGTHPEIDPELQIFVDGNDHDVFVIDNRLAFRFPKVARKIDPKRARFLDKFAQSSPLPLPSITIHHDPATGIDYEINTFLPGLPFEPPLASTFTHDELMRVAQGLGEFLSALHAFPLEEARSLAIDEMDPTDFWAYMAHHPNAYPHVQAVVFPQLVRSEQEWVAEIFEAYIAQIRATPFPICMTHSDMWVFHIIVDPEAHKLSGVIDFGLRIADPARDFKAFEFYGQEFVAEVYRNYHALVDQHFEQRRLFYTAHDLVFELARALSGDDARKIVRHKQALSAYIATHPA